MDYECTVYDSKSFNVVFEVNMSIEETPIDISVIKGLVGDDDEIINMFFNKFVDSAPGEIKEIKNAIDNNDFLEAKAKAHKLKSSAKAIGANSLGDICQKIEDESSLNEQKYLYDLYESLNEQFIDCKKYIQSK